MNQWVVIWIVLAMVLGVIEASSVNLITIWFAVSALLTSVFASLNFSIGAQVAIFIVISAVLVCITRPMAKKYFSKKTVATNADRIISAQGVVIETIDPVKGQGQIKVMGQIWSAKSSDDSVLNEGLRVKIISVEGVKAIVEEIKEV